MPLFNFGNQQQETQQQGKTSSEENVSMPFQDGQNQELIRWQLDNSAICTDMEHRFRGEEKQWDYDKHRWEYKQVRLPILNNLGISRIMTIIRSSMTQNLILSDYEKEEAYEVIKHVTIDIASILFMESDNFDLRKSDMSLVVNIVENAVKATVFRAVDGGTMAYLRQQYKSVTTNVEHGKEGAAKGFFKGIGNMFK